MYNGECGAADVHTKQWTMSPLNGRQSSNKIYPAWAHKKRLILTNKGDCRVDRPGVMLIILAWFIRTGVRENRDDGVESLNRQQNTIGNMALNLPQNTMIRKDQANRKLNLHGRMKCGCDRSEVRCAIHTHTHHATARSRIGRVLVLVRSFTMWQLVIHGNLTTNASPYWPDQ